MVPQPTAVFVFRATRSESASLKSLSLFRWGPGWRSSRLACKRTDIYIYIYIHYKKNIYIYIFTYIRQAIGQTACRDPFWMVQWPKGPTLNSIAPGDPCRLETWRCGILDGTFSTHWRSTARCFGPSSGCPKMWFFGNQRINRTWEAHVAILEPKSWFVRSHLASFFIVFVNDWKSRRCLFFNTFQWFGTFKKHYFSDMFSLIFHVFSKPLPGTIFRGSQCRAFIKSCFGCRFLFSWLSKRHPLDHLFAQAVEQKEVPLMTQAVLLATLLFTKPW